MLQWSLLVLFAVRLCLIIIPCEDCWTINLCLSISLYSRRLNDNEIPILEATGAFKKLPNLRKMYKLVYFFFSFKGFGCWMTLGYLGNSALIARNAMDNRTRKASGVFQPSPQKHAVIYCQTIFAAHSKIGKSSIRSGRGPVIYHAWNCLLSSTVINWADLKDWPYILL